MPSKHANAGSLIKRGLYDDLHSFADLEQRISALGDENTKIVGDAFEVFIEAYLATNQKMQAETVWLVGQVPLDIRLKLNLPNDAKGIDGIFGTRTGSLVPYQVKFRSQRAYLTYTEIAPFLGLTERATDRIVFTNSNELLPGWRASRFRSGDKGRKGGLYRHFCQFWLWNANLRQ